LCGLPEGFITDRILLSVSVSRQCPFSLAHLLDSLREKYLNIQTVKFILQKPVIFTSSYITEANQLRGQPSSQSVGTGCFLARGKNGQSVNLIFLPNIVPKLKVSEAIPLLSPRALMVCTVATLS
jgi:hypothetical protein